MNTRCLVELKDKQRQKLEKITSPGIYPAWQIKRAQILLKSNWGKTWSHQEISDAFDVSAVTIEKVWKALARKCILQVKKSLPYDSDVTVY